MDDKDRDGEINFFVDVSHCLPEKFINKDTEAQNFDADFTSCCEFKYAANVSLPENPGDFRVIPDQPRSAFKPAAKIRDPGSPGNGSPWRQKPWNAQLHLAGQQAAPPT